MLVISCMSEGHGSNKIENEGIRVRKSTFGGYRGNSPKLFISEHLDLDCHADHGHNRLLDIRAILNLTRLAMIATKL